MQLAKKDLNATNIEIVQEDTMCEEDAAPDAMKRLIAQGVVAVIGDLCSSSVTLAALPEANDGKVVLISPDATNPRLSVKDDYFFRVVPPDQVQADYLSKLIYNKGHKDVAVFHSDEAYGNDITAEFTKKFEALGGKVVTTQAAERGVLELDAQVKAVVDKKPDAIVILNSSTASDIAFMKLVRAAGSDVPFFSSDGIYDASLATTAGEAAEGLIFTIYPRGTEEFQNAFAAEYGSQTPINAAAEAYDAFKALYLAIEKGATTGEQIAKTLPSIDFQGVSARIRFDEFGDNSQDYQYLALEVKDGEFVPVEE